MYQKVFLIGNLGRDPEMRYTPGGQEVTNFTVASNRKYNNSQGQAITETTWWNVETWGNLAKVCNQYLTKGRQVFIEGRVKADPETGRPRVFKKQDGSAGAAFEVSASLVLFLGSRDGNGNGDMAQNANEALANAAESVSIPGLG
jgi:single-strand DNA-binding protein